MTELRTVATALITGALLLAGCAGPTEATDPAAAPDASGGLRAALPVPGAPLADGLVAFTGADSTGRIGVALVQAADGSVVAYICDGDDVWGWFEGTAEGESVDLTGDAGTFQVSLDGGIEVGSAEVGGAPVSFELEPATATSGLFRELVDDVELAWVVTNDGLVAGTAVQKEGTAVAGDSNVGTEPDVVGAESSAQQAPEVDPVIFRRLRCNLLFNQIANEQFEVNVQGDSDEQLQDLEQRFEDLDCNDFIPTVPAAPLPFDRNR